MSTAQGLPEPIPFEQPDGRPKLQFVRVLADVALADVSEIASRIHLFDDSTGVLSANVKYANGRAAQIRSYEMFDRLDDLDFVLYVHLHAKYPDGSSVSIWINRSYLSSRGAQASIDAGVREEAEGRTAREVYVSVKRLLETIDSPRFRWSLWKWWPIALLIAAWVATCFIAEAIIGPELGWVIPAIAISPYLYVVAKIASRVRQRPWLIHSRTANSSTSQWDVKSRTSIGIAVLVPFIIYLLERLFK